MPYAARVLAMISAPSLFVTVVFIVVFISVIC